MKQIQIDRLTRIVMIGVLAINTVVLAGYILNITILTSVGPGLTMMNPVTAVCFLLCCWWFLLYLSYRKRTKAVWLLNSIAAFILAIGIAKVLQYMGIFTLQFDRLLFTKMLNTANQYNAMAPNTAALFVFAGVLMLTGQYRSPFTKLTAEVLKLAGFTVAYFGIVGYIYRMKTAYEVGPFVPMALNTAICFACFFFACFLSLPKGNFSRVISSPLVGGRLARKGIPLLLTIPPMFGYFRLWGERIGLYDGAYGTAIHTGLIVLLMFIFLYLYARQLNKQDLSEKDQAAEKLAGELKYHTLVNTMKEGLLHFDANGIILLCNPALCQITGYAEEQFIGQSLFDTLIPASQSDFFTGKLASRSKGVNEDYEAQLQHKSGHLIWASIAARSLCDDSGRIIGSFSTITDITEKKKQAEDLAAFTASAAHDLNAPLARLQGGAEILISEIGSQLTTENAEILQIIHTTASEMRSMLKGLLNFSRIGSSQIERGQVDMSHLFDAAAKSHRHLNPAAQIIVSHLPTVEADGQALKHVANNLVSNALKYSSKKEQPVIEIGSLIENNKTVFYVKDNGEGFDMAVAARLFTPFQRFHTNFEGTGIGLPIAKRIIEKHGGRIWAKSAPNTGTAFYFTLQ